MLFDRFRRPERVKLYQALRRSHYEALARGAPTGRGTRYVAYSRGCGGGASFLVREEGDGGICHAYAVLALYEESGIEESSFSSSAEAMAFVASAVKELRRL